jgi:YHS domain-containing protein
MFHHMLRLIAAILASIFAISILRSVIGLIMRAFGNLVGPNLAKSAPYGQPQSSATPVAGELKKDPVCGTYVLAATAVKKISGSQTIYFCSNECRDKHSA